MDFSHYTGQAATLAAELVNLFAASPTPVCGSDVKAVLARHEVPVGRVTRAEVAGLGTAAPALREVFTALDASTGAAILNRLIDESHPRPRISEHDGQAPHLHYAAPDAGLVERVMANVVMGLAAVLCDYGVERLGACAANGCQKVFVDTSRNAQRRYCSEAHANRSNVAAHRARALQLAAAAS